MRKILITGSLGYIGSVLTPFLEAKGYECVGYDVGFFKDCLLYPARETKTIFTDARDMDEEDLKGIDAVVHLAGISNDPLKKLDAAGVYNPTRAYTMRLATMCKKQGIKFIFASSCSVYGLGGEELLTEASSTHPQTGYSLNKLQIEEDLASLSDKNFSPIALRFATVFGPSPRMRFDVVVNMIVGMAFTEGKIIMNSDGTPWRPNLHILDLCGTIWRTIELDYREGKCLILNIGDEANNLQVIQIAKIIQGAVPGCELTFLHKNPELDSEGLIQDRKVHGGTDTRTYKVSFARMRKVLGMRCGRSVEDGAEEMAEMFRKFPLTKDIFKNPNFYRLQKLESLHEKGLISDELRFL